MRTTVAILFALAGTATAAPKSKPFAASATCTAIDEAAQRTKLDPTKRVARPKTTHKIECAIASVDARIMDAKVTGRATRANGDHVDAEGKVVGDVQVRKDIRRLLMVEWETDKWDRCENVDLDLAIKNADGAALWSLGVKTSGSCAKK